MDPKTTKAHLRASIKERMARMRPHDLVAESRTLCKEAAALLPKQSSAIAAYVPLPDEADIRGLLETILARGHQLFLPAFDGKKLAFRRVDDLSTLVRGPLRTMDAPEEGDELEPASLALAFIPGRAFTAGGHRLGRGNGGYDKWIAGQRAANPATRFLGVALECQLVNELPMEPHDAKVDAIVTARGIIEN